MTYVKATSFLNSLAFRGIKLGLENIAKLLSRLGDPHKKYKTIHVAGTNGKGSTATMISSILTRAGIANGLYTSPHLESFRERIEVSGKMMGEQDAMMAISNAKWAMEQKPAIDATYFEFMTALAFLHFARANIEVAVTEVGLGGRHDSTNVVDPIVSIITSIGLDHQEHLGSTLTAIAREKCGIIKHGRPLILGVKDRDIAEVAMEIANERSAPVQALGKDFTSGRVAMADFQERFNFSSGSASIENIELALAGRLQIDNASCAIAAVLELNSHGFEIGVDAVREGLSSVACPGRFEVAQRSPLVILDGAHNVKAATALNATLLERFGKGKIDFIFGAMKDKNYKEMIKNLVPSARSFAFFSASVPRAESQGELANAQSDESIPTSVMGNLEDVIEFIKKAPQDCVICVTGSFFTVGEIRAGLRKLGRGDVVG